MKTLFFVLGGCNAEMETIKRILCLAGETWVRTNVEKISATDCGLRTVRVSGHQGRPGTTEMETVSEAIFVQCRPGDGWYCKQTEIETGVESGASSVLEVLRVLENRTIGCGEISTIKGRERFAKPFVVSGETRRWAELVGAYGQGDTTAMLALGATSEEVARVLELDRVAKLRTEKAS